MRRIPLKLNFITVPSGAPGAGIHREICGTFSARIRAESRIEQAFWPQLGDNGRNAADDARTRNWTLRFKLADFRRDYRELRDFIRAEWAPGGEIGDKIALL